ncbi:MAG: type II secretion system protein G [Candidatus Wallbacteria bacterium HGW-Wallbacteria-1]|uniref:Type II secretion system protein G n=1 Tax=Candidatus Wallbacteria bacterium HGW-Wallbacteria-1 TaxID=2013854 RepID=A0A2N1PV05_9BACT|nr:MAG: type II secretion system protein G [Candidatus Wallbacteria bacterium HGW-Wallbacteria-1]
MFHGKSCDRGFTLIELAIVITIIGILYVSVVPFGAPTVKKSKESVLAHNLKVLRDSIDQYNADFGQYPPDLEQLVERRYIREIPIDPFTEKRDTWTTSSSSPEKMDVYDVKSGESSQGSDGRAFSEW